MQMKNTRWMQGLLMAALAMPACSSAQTPPAPAEPAAPPAVANAERRSTLAREKAAEFRARGAVFAQAGKGVNVWYNRTGGKKEKAAYLGVVMVQADAALRDQLKMPRGIGLIVQSVADNTPASKAGVQAHDLITKLDDQWLVNAQQFGVLIRMHKADDEITLTGLRHGEPITIKAKLVEKDMVINDTGDEAPTEWGVNNLAIDTNGLQALQALSGWASDDDAPLVIHDNNSTLTVTLDNGERHLVARDNNDNVLFDGPVETEDQRKALPGDLSVKLDKYKEQFDKVKEGGKQRTRIINNDR